MKDILVELFTRDLKKLKTEITSYTDETSLWRLENAIKNSGGNLCLHIIGNLQYFVGNGIGQSGYVRDRNFEFAGSNVPRAKLLTDIDETIDQVKSALMKLSETDFKADFPIIIWDKPTGMAFTLIHLHSHLSYHLGQINYHRRLLEKI